MPTRRQLLAASPLALAAALPGCASNPPPPPEPVALPTREDARLMPVYQSERMWNGVTTTDNGRVFVCFTGAEGRGVQVGELVGGVAKAYPDPTWNAWERGRGGQDRFVHVNALRIGPGGDLWVVDAGAASLGEGTVPFGPKVIRIDVLTNKVKHVYPLGDATRATSFVDDIRFNDQMAYLTDAGAPGLIVMDLRTGRVHRVLDGAPSVIMRKPLRADGRVILKPDGKPLEVHADQLEVTPDGQFLYFQPCSGPLFRVSTRLLDDPQLPADRLAAAVEPWLDTPSCGGTAIDADGVIYYSDVDHRRILRITPDKQMTTLIADPRLIWADAMWIDKGGFLWIPATQQNLGAGFNNGNNAVRYPVWLYKMQINARPSPRDHS